MLYGMTSIRTKKSYRSSVETKHVQKNGQGIAKWLDFVQNPSILACLQFGNDIQSYILYIIIIQTLTVYSGMPHTFNSIVSSFSC